MRQVLETIKPDRDALKHYIGIMRPAMEHLRPFGEHLISDRNVLRPENSKYGILEGS